MFAEGQKQNCLPGILVTRFAPWSRMRYGINQISGKLVDVLINEYVGFVVREFDRSNSRPDYQVPLALKCAETPLFNLLQSITERQTQQQKFTVRLG